MAFYEDLEDPEFKKINKESTPRQKQNEYDMFDAIDATINDLKTNPDNARFVAMFILSLEFASPMHRGYAIDKLKQFMDPEARAKYEEMVEKSVSPKMKSALKKMQEDLEKRKAEKKK